MKINQISHDYHPYDHRLEIAHTCSQCGHTRGYTELHEDHVQLNRNPINNDLSISITCMECRNVDTEKNPEWQIIDNEYAEKNYFRLEPSETEDNFDLNSFD